MADLLILGNLKVPVHVLEERRSFGATGRLDLLVRPIGGSGERWVWSSRVERATSPPERGNGLEGKRDG